VSGPSLFAERIVIAAVYLDMFKKFIVPSSFGERYALPSRQSAFIFTPQFERDFVDRKILWTWIGIGGPITWPSRSRDLKTTFLLEAGNGSCLEPNTLPKLAGRYELLQLHLPPPSLKICARNLNTDVTWAGISTVSWFHICELLSGGRKKRDAITCQNTFSAFSFVSYFLSFNP